MKKTQIFKYGLAGLVSLITFLVYLPALRNGLVTWDDPTYIYKNNHILSLDPSYLKWAFWESSYASNWHPLTWLSHALDYSLWGLNPAGHHSTSIILHCMNTFLVTVLAIKLIEIAEIVKTAGGPSFSHLTRHALLAASVTGLLFGIHPIHFESVAWVSERKEI